RRESRGAHQGERRSVERARARGAPRRREDGRERDRDAEEHLRRPRVYHLDPRRVLGDPSRDQEDADPAERRLDEDESYRRPREPPYGAALVAPREPRDRDRGEHDERHGVTVRELDDR